MTCQIMATRGRDLLKKGNIQISSLKATHIYKSHENLDFRTPSPLFLSSHLQTGYPFSTKLSECIDFFGRVRCTKILRIGGPFKSKRLTHSFCACVRTMLRYGTCQVQIQRGDRGSGPPWKITSYMGFYRE